MRTFLAIIIVVMAGLAAAGCKDDKTNADSAKDITIGEYASLTGGTATFGQSSHEGTVLAMEEINKAGGVLGKQIKLVWLDDRSDAGEAVTAVTRLINRDKVVAMLGEVASTRSIAGGNICQKNKIPMLSPASTNPDVTKVGDYIFRICFTDDFQGAECARFALKKGWKKVAILTDVANDYSKGLSQAFRETFTAGGGQVAGEDTYRQDDNDFRAQLTKIKGMNVDAVFVPGYYNDVGQILRQGRQLGMSIPFFGGDGWDDPKTFLALGSIADGCYFTNHYAADDTRPEVQDFIRKYKDRYNGKTPDAMAILGYDSMRVMADAIKRAGKVDSTAIRDALAATKDYPGASGTITIDANRNVRKPIVVVELVGGKMKLLETIAPQ